MTREKNQVLFEIGTEEIPARFILPALEQIQENLRARLEEERLNFSALKTYATPRRLAVLLEGVPQKQENRILEFRGPARRVAFDDEGNPTRAGMGFARSKGLEPEDLEIREDNGQEYVFARQKDEGRTARECLAEILPAVALNLNFPKTMRWGTGEHRFARPIHWVVALFEDQVIPFTLAGQPAGQVSRGHRFWGAEEIFISHPDEYLDKLEEGYVLADYERRRKIIEDKAAQEAKSLGGEAVYDQDLLWEITFLVEYPRPIVGRFQEKYLELPQEVLIVSMQKHQKYMPIRGSEGLLPGFITFISGPGAEEDLVRFGNEKVLQARLDDAFFFLQEDSAKTLAEHAQGLARVVFMEGLGSMQEKTERLQRIMEELGSRLGWNQETTEKGRTAAHLCKADLTTQMVDEFPELQGIMGFHYGQQEGLEIETARAIAEHYQPRFRDDELPSSELGGVLALAEKLDNIGAAFYTGNIPSGSQDPLALRRQGLAAVKIMNRLEYDLPLSDLLGILEMVYTEQGYSLQEHLAEVKEFLQKRMGRFMEEEGFRYDIIEAVLAGGDLQVQSGLNRGQALAELRGDEKFTLLVQSAIRARNILKNREAGAEVRPELLEEEAEQKLWQELQALQEKIVQLEKEGSFPELFSTLASLAGPLEEFFDQVMVMAEDKELQANRLALLEKIRSTLNQGVDLTCIVLD